MRNQPLTLLVVPHINRRAVVTPRQKTIRFSAVFLVFQEEPDTAYNNKSSNDGNHKIFAPLSIAVIILHRQQLKNFGFHCQ